LAFYDKVVDIWYKFVAAARTDAELADTLSASQLSEGVDMITYILQTRAKLLGINHIATGEARYTLGLLHVIRGDISEARECISGACDIYGKHLGSEHPSTRDILNVLLQINQEPQDDDYN